MRKDLIILSNDPSMTAWGYSVIRNGCIMDSGCIVTEPTEKVKRIRKSDDDARRVSEIVQRLLHIIQVYGVNYMVAESPGGSKSYSAAKSFAQVISISQTLSDCLKIPLEFFSEAEAKKAVFGPGKKRTVSKLDMMREIDKLFLNVGWSGKKYIDEAVADSLAVYVAAKQLSNTLKFIQL